jgi:DNA (cytosine-5)-methyltransferase 1
MSDPLLLDLFCCQGGASRGYADAGLEVVGVDIEAQPRYPRAFRFIKIDALDLLDHLCAGGIWRGLALADIAAIHASPPCQGYSDTQRLRGNDHPRLIGQVRELLQQTGLPYVIENVPGARGELRKPVMLCGAMFPGLRVYRHRYFEIQGFGYTPPAHPVHVAPQVKMGRPPAPGEWVQAVGNFSGVAEAREAMGMPWANRDGLREAIPPAYTEHIGRQLMAAVNPMEAAA